ncbi:uncharacterized protein F5891DRAFT_1063743 [Suillus fuscotomentosus]|uniref:Uncharacterized protein n=1 Tax=Suillus fuscotomentosus TaxID=1912939 RepID=A0AAD4DUF4_9AGAM|nr:uncharacterized protein F5891DRAFT_1063667 [Suillus fuscotomentosus]XP_041219637.1 uncharacterized protein F5891DRAFT_1063743 [Suillus fuscotomentosus]KAG1894049.1 hypothetical protein F5891DRAFT_1063667 [Suillus fuscotomentosus]KAG1894061.1 hypothetical protein F5891DRAFT_1063743 [Suillus fuscotomentosus]
MTNAWAMLDLALSHLHGLEDGAIHLCMEERSRSMQYPAEGIREFETARQSINATFTGRHQTFRG